MNRGEILAHESERDGIVRMRAKGMAVASAYSRAAANVPLVAVTQPSEQNPEKACTPIATVPIGVESETERAHAQDAQADHAD